MPRKSIAQQVDRLKTRRRSTRPAELHRFLVDAGFERRMGKGDHWVYSHPELAYPLTIDPRNPLLPAYVSKALRAVKEVTK